MKENGNATAYILDIVWLQFCGRVGALAGAFCHLESIIILEAG